jgi:hypothetical protein
VDFCINDGGALTSVSGAAASLLDRAAARDDAACNGVAGNAGARIRHNVPPFSDGSLRRATCFGARFVLAQNHAHVDQVRSQSR